MSGVKGAGIHIVDLLIGMKRALQEEIPVGQSKLLVTLSAAAACMLVYVIVQGTLEGTLTTLVRDLAPLLVLAWSGGLILAAGKVDISIAGVATLSGILFATIAQLVNAVQPLDYLLAGIAPVMLGIVIGCVNGYVVAGRRAPALLVTWSTGTVCFSVAGVLALVFSKHGLMGSSSGISLPGLIPPLSWSNPFLFLSIAVCGLVALCIVVFRLGWLARLVGSNELSAAYSGFHTGRTVIMLFVISGMFAAIAGCLLALGAWSASTKEHLGKEMIALAIAVLGGTVMSGGYFSLMGILVGGVFWVLLDRIFARINLGAGVDEGRILLAVFALLIIAVSILLGRNLSGEFRTIHAADNLNR